MRGLRAYLGARLGPRLGPRLGIGPGSRLRARLRAARDRLRPDAPVLLWWLALIAALPMLVLAVHDVVSRLPPPRDPDTARALEGQELLAVAAGPLAQQLADAASLLRGLAALPMQGCAAGVAGRHWPNGIALYAADGTMLCANGEAVLPGAAVASEFVRAALLARQRAPVLAGLSSGWLGSRAATVMAMAVAPDETADEARAAPPAVLALGLGLDWLQGDATHSMLLADPTDLTLLAGHGGDATTRGRPLAWPQVLRALREGRRSGVALVPEGGAQARRHGLAVWRVIDGAGRPPVLLASYWPPLPETVIGPPNLFTLLWQVELMLVIGLALAWLLVGRRLAQWLQALSQGRTLDERAPRMLRAISARLAAHAARDATWQTRLAAMQAELRVLANGAGEIFELLDANLARRAVYGACLELLGRSPEGLLAQTPETDRPAEDWARLRAALGEVAAGRSAALVCETRVRRLDGGLVWLESRLSPLPGGGVLMVSRDISRWRESEQALAEADRRLAALAMEDELTGLANRRRFDTALSQELRRASRSGSTLGLVLLELDGAADFRARDPAAADATLRLVARAASGALLRPGDLAARLDGDRLALLLPGASHDGAAAVAQRVLAAIDAVLIADAPVSGGKLSPRAGIAVAGAHTPGPARLLAEAEAALRAGKEESSFS